MRVWERVLREVIGIFWLSTHTPNSDWIFQCEWESEVRIIFFRKALLKTHTPHSNCLYQCECESEYWERFLEYFDSLPRLKLTPTLAITVGVWERVLREVLGFFLTLYPHWIIQWECEDEYREMFSDFFFDSSLRLTLSCCLIYPRVKTYIFPARRCTSLSIIRMQGVHGMDTSAMK